jgi:heme O synthase-like polyprenyltransferase
MSFDNLTDRDQAEWEARHDNVIKWGQTWSALAFIFFAASLYVFFANQSPWGWIFVFGWVGFALAYTECEKRHVEIHAEIEDE